MWVQTSHHCDFGQVVKLLYTSTSLTPLFKIAIECYFSTRLLPSLNVCRCTHFLEQCLASHSIVQMFATCIIQISWVHYSEQISEAIPGICSCLCLEYNLPADRGMSGSGRNSASGPSHMPS
jgi:hypothetical protein